MDVLLFTREQKTFNDLRRPTPSRRVVAGIVEFLPSLHLLEPIRLRAGLFQIAQKFLARFHGHAERALRENDHAITELRKFFERN
jgi:hypothetical protein